MSKNIVLCSDGTGNTANKGRGTNVWKVFEAVDLNGHKDNPNLPQQIAFYDDGVGTESFKPLKLITGALGIGLTGSVKRLYTELCRAYAPGDKVYLFGFSRGAFTVRTLSGLIGRCGIIDIHPPGSGNEKTTLNDADLKKLVEKAYYQFRKHFRRRWSEKLHRFILLSSTAEEATKKFAKEHAVKHKDHEPTWEAKIKFVGVWDTVDAVGLPIVELATMLNQFWPYKWQNHELGKHVQKGCHALAIDDERKSFHPTMWKEKKDDNERIEQVWFAGVHSNVGGGYPKQGMSLVPLCWMMQKAHEAGLRFRKESVRAYQDNRNVSAKLYDTRAGLANYYRYEPRNIAKLCKDNGVYPKIHTSVLYRTSLGTAGYAPGNFPGDFELVPTETEHGPYEEDEQLKEIVKDINNDNVPHDKPLRMDRKTEKRCIRTRICSYYALLFVTAIALVLSSSIVAPEPKTPLLEMIHAVTSSVPLVGDRIYNLITSYVWLSIFVLVVALLYFASLAARRKLYKEYSIFWRTKFNTPGDEILPVNQGKSKDASTSIQRATKIKKTNRKPIGSD